MTPQISPVFMATVLVSISTSLAFGFNLHGLSTAGDRLLGFDHSGSVFSDVAINGLNAGDSLVDIDVFFSGDKRLYGLGVSGTLYTINPLTGSAAANVLNAAVGSPVAIDFNPAADRLRIFSGDANYRLTPNTGVVSVDGTLAYAAADVNATRDPNLRAAAYINNVDNPGATALYSIDSDLDILVLHSGGPQFSTLNTVSGLTLGGAAFDASANVGFDVFSPVTGVNHALLSKGNDLYRINLGTGELSALGSVSSSLELRSIAVAVPEHGGYLSAISLFALGGLASIMRKAGK